MTDMSGASPAERRAGGGDSGAAAEKDSFKMVVTCRLRCER